MELYFYFHCCCTHWSVHSYSICWAHSFSPFLIGRFSKLWMWLLGLMCTAWIVHSYGIFWAQKFSPYYFIERYSKIGIAWLLCTHWSVHSYTREVYSESYKTDHMKRLSIFSTHPLSAAERQSLIIPRNRFNPQHHILITLKILDIFVFTRSHYS